MKGFFCVFSFVLLFSFATKSAIIELTDITGRLVKIDTPLTKFIISEGRYISSLVLLRPDNPLKGMVGMMTPLSYTNPAMEKVLFNKFPAARNIPLFGSNSAESVSVEKIIDLNPQVAIFGLNDHGPGARNEHILDQLKAAGIAVVFIDFRSNPLKNTTRSIEILGRIFGKEDRATQFKTFFNSRFSRVRNRVSKIKNRPSVFLQVHAGRRECCWGMADGMLGPYVGVAGGHNIADAVAPGPTSKHTHEFLLAENPDVWIGGASGSLKEYLRGGSAVTVGAGMTKTMSEKSLGNYLSSPEFQALDAVRNGRAHSYWHNFYNSPFNFCVLEAFAKWIHPEHFQDIHPQSCLTDSYNKFMPFEIDGNYFATYQESNF